MTRRPDPSKRQSRFDPDFVGWRSLFSIHRDTLDTATRELMKRYSSYKFGSYPETQRFTFELRILVQTALRGESLTDSAHWIVFSPPYNSNELEPSARAIGDAIARGFNLPHIDFRTEQEEARQVSYAAIADPGMRAQARDAIQTTVNDPLSLAGQYALIIDDMVTTGATAAFMERTLYNRYHLKQVAGFCLINLLTDDPTFEQYVNGFIVGSGDFDTLISILNDPRTTINRHALKSLYADRRHVLNAIAPRLLRAVIDKIEKARATYLPDS